MPVVDIIILAVWLGFIFYGLFFGLIRALGALLGLIIGLWAASHFYLGFYDWLKQFVLADPVVGKPVSFFLLFGLVSAAVKAAVLLLDRAVHLLSIIPFLKTINRIAGAVFGALEGLIFWVLILLWLDQFQLAEAALKTSLQGSKLAPLVVQAGQWLKVFLPHGWEGISSWWA